MAKGRMAGVSVLLWLVFLALIVGGCATQKADTQKDVVSEFVLKQAGFKKWNVNYQTPERAAMMSSVPKGQLTKFDADGKTYYVYNDPNHDAIYTGDEIAYQNYLHLAHGQNACQVTHGTNNANFWGCFQDYEQRHKAGAE
jgi:hypothetical protein